MQNEELHFHYVSTLGEARELVDRFDRFWVSNCGCREEHDGCKRSRLDLCLFFDPQMGGTGSDFREVDREFVQGILKETEEKHLISRPFRYEDDKSRVQGICFCCDDCCWYFKKDGKYECDKGKYVERTDGDSCEGCGTCVDVCYYGAREIVEGEMTVANDKCFGCALCVDVCPEGCVTMVER